MADDAAHEPVLVGECLEWLVAPAAGGLLLDGTVGDGGHAARFLDRYPSLSLLAVDADERMLARARSNLARFGDRVEFVHGWFADVLAGITRPPDLVLLDLGVASLHFDASGRGFSFRGAEPLDMRLTDRLPRTAADILNEESESDLADLFYYNGEERHARRLAREVVRSRAAQPFQTTDQLERIAWRVYRAAQRNRRSARGRGIHPATRVFQALRIAVNDELERLQQGLTEAIRRLAPAGRLGVIAFHSLEDRIVKRTLLAAAQPSAAAAPSLRLLTKRPLRPTADELQRNPRARSARLRVAEKLATAPVAISPATSAAARAGATTSPATSAATGARATTSPAAAAPVARAPAEPAPHAGEHDE